MDNESAMPIAVFSFQEFAICYRGDAIDFPVMFPNKPQMLEEHTSALSHPGNEGASIMTRSAFLF